MQFIYNLANCLIICFGFVYFLRYQEFLQLHAHFVFVLSELIDLILMHVFALLRANLLQITFDKKFLFANRND